MRMRGREVVCKKEPLAFSVLMVIAVFGIAFGGTVVVWEAMDLLGLTDRPD